MLTVIALCLALESGLAIAVRLLGATCPIWLLLLGHSLISLLFALSATRRLGEYMAIRLERDVWLFFSLSLFLPLVGQFGLCWVLFAFQRWYGAERAAPVKLIRAQTLELSGQAAMADVMPPLVNTGMLISVLQHATKPEQRTAAILATLRLPDHDAINILRVALRDSEDDIRLLAYALLAQMDKRYNTEIQSTLALLEQADEAQKPMMLKHVAQEYWELAWIGLARGETVKPILDKALQFARQALDGGSEDAGLQFLLGKILLRLKQFDEARSAFWRAELYGMEAARMAPYLREMMMSQHRTPGVGSWLSSPWQADLDAGLASDPLFQEVA